jgi:hypothetical protein
MGFIKPLRLIIIVLTALGVLFSACSDDRNTGVTTQEFLGQETHNIPERPPLLDVGFVSGNTSAQRIRTTQLTYDWIIADENGDGVGIHADSPHPLQLRDYDEITLFQGDANSNVEMQFTGSYPPSSVSVQRWDAQFIGSEDYSLDIWDKGESVTVSENLFSIGDDGRDYVYEVYATWNEGSSRYAFLMTSSATRIDESLPTISKANIFIDHATDELLQRFEPPYEYVVDENGGLIIIWADRTVYDFSLFEVGHEFTDDDFAFYVDTVLFSVEEMPQDKPFTVKMYTPETLPTHGISYRDGDNEIRYLTIHESGKDGSMFLLDLES